MDQKDRRQRRSNKYHLLFLLFTLLCLSHCIKKRIAPEHIKQETENSSAQVILTEHKTAEFISLLSEARDTFNLISGIERTRGGNSSGKDTLNIINGFQEFSNDTLYYDDNSPYNKRTLFKDKLIILTCIFEGKYAQDQIWAFPSGQYDSSVSILYTDCTTDLLFEDCQFKKIFTLYNPEIKNKVLFSNCNLSEGASFHPTMEYTEQKDYAEEGNVLFGRTNTLNFYSDVKLYKTKLRGTLDFNHCKFKNKSNLILKNCDLPDTLDLSYAELSGIVDLKDTYNNKATACEINLLHTDIDKISMSYQNFHLYFPKPMMDSAKYADLISSTYQLLLNNFKNNGYTDSYEKLDIDFKDWQSKNDPTLTLSKIWWWYGYKKGMILLWTIGFIFLFSVYNHQNYSKLQQVYPVENLSKKRIAYSDNKFYSFLKKYFLTLLYTGIIFFRFSIDFKNVNIKPMRYVVMIIIQYTIGLVCTGFLINWILKG